MHHTSPIMSSGSVPIMIRSVVATVIAVLLALMMQGGRCSTGSSIIGGGGTAAAAGSSVLVVGSVNVDIIMDVARLPGRGETTTSLTPSAGIAVGGKGANQAVAAARLLAPGRRCRFVCRFGNDSHATWLQQELQASGVDITGCSRAPSLPSGQGMVMLEPDGTASSVVLGGANTEWPEVEELHNLMSGVGMVLLQREIPEHVNLAVARAAAAAGVPVIQDVGGEDRPFAAGLLPLLAVLSPNESELQRLTGLPTATDEQVVAAAKALLQQGPRSVLVTLAERGSLLVAAEGDGGISTLWQQPVGVPGEVVDATAAGDAFRAAVAVALVEGRPMHQALRFAAAAGAITVSRKGAMPSLPTRAQVDGLNGSGTDQAAAAAAAPTTAAAASTCDAAAASKAVESEGSSSSRQGSMGGAALACPLRFASRLNSMKARRDLAVAADGGDDVLGWIARQGRVKGLHLVDLNYPEHFQGVQTEQVQAALTAAGLAAGAICMRFPPAFQAGAFSNPNATLRHEAVQLSIDGCRQAARLGASELIVWSPFDGYNYLLQIDYTAAWQRTVASFQQLADACPGIRVSLEFKPTDPSSRFSIVPSTGAALLLVRDRPNLGLTLDFGHLLLAGENPAQSVAMVAAAGKLFGLQLNDAHVRLGAEDGLAFGSVNTVAALELVWWLRKTGYDGHVYFDTFPEAECPVREAELNIRVFKAMWRKAGQLERAGIGELAARHDAMGVLELLAGFDHPE